LFAVGINADMFVTYSAAVSQASFLVPEKRNLRTGKV